MVVLVDNGGKNYEKNSELHTFVVLEFKTSIITPGLFLNKRRSKFNTTVLPIEYNCATNRIQLCYQ